MTAPAITTINATTTVTTTVVVPPVAPKEHKENSEQKEQRTVAHKLLARQLEYYFSTANLSKDTYLSTLRDLNDSYVPISIIANFGKVQALTSFGGALEAVVAAATDHSDFLEIVELDEGGKKITDKKDESELTTPIILAVGSITGKPIPMSQIPKTEKPKKAKTSAPPSSNTPVTAKVQQSPSTRNVQNTIILREVAKGTDEETLRNLFGFEGCPSIESIREDLHNCWFITLDTSSKDDMFNVMMKLRTAKFPSGDSVKARLKSSATASPLTPNAVVYNPQLSMMYAPQFNTNSGGSTNSRKKRSNNKGRSNNNNNNNGGNSNNKSKNNQQNGGNGSKRRGNKDTNSKQTSSNDGSKTRSKKVTMKAPSMGVNNFPSLPPTSEENTKSVQVDKVVMDGEMMKGCGKERNSASGFSDSSSTATTSTASTPTEAPPSGVMSGYAAALLKPAAPVPVAPKKPVLAEKPRQQAHSPSKKTKDNAKKVTKTKEAKTDDKKQPIESYEQPAVTVKPPSWGQGRSFADIVSA
mmetsp:Transcript_2303/g.5475  ORF Transcript_2303/g.5475 Transcript_2303/m.5475 type:complete len:526 (-) Transcript_2303:55-1632(-)|eukprot:CAMPEP_0116107670 /NCGR_PEP_ID=MMETSP0327-20121206/16352_1 /TAXON_ID=44447 /ORGANISM="Pseudo-nitzschia delicatissima, Strain B596" /LENGTH=525 /DNA_ID=CAMNT_0003600483 /DNA_START=327 /DNA_END=1904 /DNA_ORIENTATION=-